MPWRFMLTQIMQWAIQRSQPVSWTCIVFMFDGGPVSWTGQVFLVKHSCNVFMWSRNQCSSMQRQRQKRLLLWGSRIAYVYSQYKAGIYYSSPLTIDILCCILVYVCQCHHRHVCILSVNAWGLPSPPVRISLFSFVKMRNVRQGLDI
jgi:hypothetical protein